MSNCARLRSLFTNAFQETATVGQAVNFLERNGFYDDCDDDEQAQKMIREYKKHEARRFICSVKDREGKRIFASVRSKNQNFYTNLITEKASKRLKEAEKALLKHYKGTKRNYGNVRAKRFRAESVENELD